MARRGGFLTAVLVAVISFLAGAVAAFWKAFGSSGAGNAAAPGCDHPEEENLETTDPRALVDASPRPDDLRERADVLAESVRKRIRDRTRGVISGDRGD